MPCPEDQVQAPVVEAVAQPSIQWAYGVTTVPGRRRDLLPQTLASLRNAGFDKPRLFVDGDHDVVGWSREFDLQVTCRFPKIRTYGNWLLSIYELYVREPHAHRYAIFQDDFVILKNTRPYLDSIPYPEDGYLNLHTFTLENEKIINESRSSGFMHSAPLRTNRQDGPKLQGGRGAVALVFSRDVLGKLLTSRVMFERPQEAKRGWRNVDGGIVTALNYAGIFEYIHKPSLTQHTGKVSSMMSRPHRPARSFPGEHFDALTFLQKK